MSRNGRTASEKIPKLILLRKNYDEVLAESQRRRPKFFRDKPEAKTEAKPAASNGSTTATMPFLAQWTGTRLNCSVCGRRIGKTATQYRQRRRHGSDLHPVRNPSMHTAWYPNCDGPDHRFVFDHRPGHATRAGAWYVLTETNVLA